MQRVLWTLVLAWLLFSTANANGDCRNYRQLMHELSDQYHDQTLSSLSQDNCTQETIGIRKEWDSLRRSERLDYLSAVQCLQSSPGKTKNNFTRSRYDDFTLAHVDQTLFIHFSGLLLPWHRYFLFLFEQALREECGYKGRLPYWDWSKYVQNLSESSVFDGSPYSFSGNGRNIPHGNTTVVFPGGPPPRVSYERPPGTGGGCVEGGPFSNYEIELGPVLRSGSGSSTVVSKQPRCLTRDFLIDILNQKNSYQNVTDLILKSSNIHEFHSAVESRSTGAHAGGHEFIGGENLDLYTSPNDPVFYLHHAMLDRVWAIWQSRDLNERTFALDGTLTFMNYPPSPNATVSDLLRYGDWTAEIMIGNTMSTSHGPLCYMYQ